MAPGKGTIPGNEGIRRRGGKQEDESSMSERELEMERRALALERKEVELLKREMLLAKQAMEKKNGGEDTSQAAQMRKALGGRKATMQEGTLPKQMIGVVGIPLLILAVVYPLCVYMYHDGISSTPCQGICNVTAEMRAAAPEGCKPDGTSRIFLPHTEQSGMPILMAVADVLKKTKTYEVVRLRNWRDAVYAKTTGLSGMARMQTSEQQYEWMFHERQIKAVQSKSAYPRLMFSTSYFHDLNRSTMEAVKGESLLGAGDLATDALAHVVLLREPLTRISSQYARDAEFDAGKARAGWGSATAITKMDFAECVNSPLCRHEYRLAKWCNAQTRMLCGWGSGGAHDAACAYNDAGNATEAMLERALEHLRANVSVVGIAEEMRATLGTLAAVHPQFFEGAAAAWEAGLPGNCPAPRAAAPCPFAALALAEVPAGVRAVLEPYCWADLALYREGVRLLHAQAAACGAGAALGRAA